MAASTERLHSLLEPTVRALGCGIWGIELESLGRRSLLRIYIDREEGITIDDCERVSRAVSDVLDVEEPLTAAYTLEVSSPGLDRVLFTEQQYREAIGSRVDVRLRAPFEGRRRWVGVLAEVEREAITLRVDEREDALRVNFDDIGKTRIVPVF